MAVKAANWQAVEIDIRRAVRVMTAFASRDPAANATAFADGGGFQNPRIIRWTERLRRGRGERGLGCGLDVSFRAGGRAVARRTINERRPPCRHCVCG